MRGSALPGAVGESDVIRREQLYREGRPMADPAGRTVIVVDDGLATGASMRAATPALRRMKPARMVPAVPAVPAIPAAPASTCEELELEVDEVVCATTPSPFFAVGRSYRDFAKTTDQEVRDLLRARPDGGSVNGAGTCPHR
jgi:predicted phosphoribosyltransferase